MVRICSEATAVLRVTGYVVGKFVKENKEVGSGGSFVLEGHFICGRVWKARRECGYATVCTRNFVYVLISKGWRW